MDPSMLQSKLAMSLVLLAGPVDPLPFKVASAGGPEPVQMQVSISRLQFLQWLGLLTAAEETITSVTHCRTALLTIEG